MADLLENFAITRSSLWKLKTEINAVQNLQTEINYANRSGTEKMFR